MDGRFETSLFHKAPRPNIASTLISTDKLHNKGYKGYKGYLSVLTNCTMLLTKPSEKQGEARNQIKVIHYYSQ
jgi:hypothetical protein